MEYEKIKQLIEDIGNSKLSSIDITFPDGTQISMKKEQRQEAIVVREIEKQDKTIKEENVNLSKEVEKKGNIITSPMVGTFYTKPNPTSEPYVKLGKQVKQGDTLCIIEAMKLMNEIESEFTGKITEIFVKDGQTVEYGTALFRVE